MKTVLAARDGWNRPIDTAGYGPTAPPHRPWPRGLRKKATAVDIWAKQVAPTPALRKWFDHRPDRFEEFERRYLQELESNRTLPELLEELGKAKAITLLYAAKDPAINHAVVLATFLNKLRLLGSEADSHRHCSMNLERNFARIRAMSSLRLLRVPKLFPPTA
jgi:uncharacterized protein YeaO (DUF488 family)